VVLGERAVLHVDFDHFYAQCEEVRQPSLRTLPVCVCIYSDRGGDSGAVATANYPARKFGAKSGLSISRAKRLLEGTGARFIPVDFEYYSDVSEKAMAIMEGYADTFEYVGRDEAYLDVTERTGGSLKTAAHLAQQIKNSIRESLRLTCSAGVSRNKLVSKIASGYKKPDGLTVVGAGSEESFLEGLHLRDIPGIGGKTAKRLGAAGMTTVVAVRAADVFDLQRVFGRKIGTYVYNSVRGINEDPVQERPPSVQFSKIVTLKRNTTDPDELTKALRGVCESLHGTLVGQGMLFRLVGIQFVHADLSMRTRSRTLRNHTVGLETLQAVSGQLLAEILTDAILPVRRLGVKVSDLTKAAGQQTMSRYF
jgi:DNA polymerase IV (DinB-like DNA polymerase)